MRGPLFRPARSQIRVAWTLTGRAVDEFAQYVRVTQVVGPLSNHVYQNLVQGDLTPVLRPPGTRPGRPQAASRS